MRKCSCCFYTNICTMVAPCGPQLCIQHHPPTQAGGRAGGPGASTEHLQVDQQLPLWSQTESQSGLSHIHSPNPQYRLPPGLCAESPAPLPLHTWLHPCPSQQHHCEVSRGHYNGGPKQLLLSQKGPEHFKRRFKPWPLPLWTVWTACLNFRQMVQISSCKDK